MNWSVAEEKALKQLIQDELRQHLYSHHTPPPQMMSGGDSSDAKPEEPTTQQLTQAMDITVLSNFQFVLGKALEDLDIHINKLMKRRDTLLNSYRNVQDGVNGLPVAESLGFVDEILN